MDNILERLEEEYLDTLNAFSATRAGSEDEKKLTARLNLLHRMVQERRTMKLNVDKFNVDEEVKRYNIIRDVDNDKIDWEVKRHKMTMDEREMDVKTNTSYIETEIKEKQAKDSKRDKIIGYVISAAGIILPICVSCFWMSKGLQFETTGTYTSKTLKWISDTTRLFKK